MILITPELKDQVLAFLVNECELEQLSEGETSNFLTSLSLPFETFNAVMKYFERNGLVEDLNLRYDYCLWIVRAEASELFYRGGFNAQEVLFRANVDKLLLEVDALKKELPPNWLEKLNHISSIATALVGGIALFRK